MNRTSLAQLVIVLIVVMFAAVPKVEAQEMSLMDYYKWGSIDSSLQKYGQKYRYLYDEMARRFTEIKTIDYINSLTDKRLWPKALQSKTRNPKILNKYKSYLVTNKYVYYGNYIFGHHYLVFIPKDLNTKMPLDYRPENDFVIFQEAPSSGFNYKKRIDFSQYLPKPPVCNQFSYLYKLVEEYQNLLINTHSEGIMLENGNRLYPCKKLIPGFQNLTEGITRYGDQYLVSTFDAGLFKEDALRTFDKMLEALYSNGECAYAFRLNRFGKTDAELVSTNKNYAPFTINLTLASEKDSNKHFQINLAIFKTIQDSIQKEWMKMGESAISTLQENGYERVTTKANTSDKELIDTLLINEGKLLQWFLFVSDSSVQMNIANEAGSMPIDLGIPQKFPNAWLYSGNYLLGPVNHKVQAKMNGSSPGYWSFYAGLKKSETPNEAWNQYVAYKERARKVTEDSLKNVHEYWAKVQASVIKEMTDAGYYNVTAKWVDGNYSVEFEDYFDFGFFTEWQALFVVCTLFENINLEVLDKNGKLLPCTTNNNENLFVKRLTFKTVKRDRFSKFTVRFSEQLSGKAREEQGKKKVLFFMGSQSLLSGH